MTATLFEIPTSLKVHTRTCPISMTVNELFATILRLESEGSINDALDALFIHVDELGSKHKFSQIDKIISDPRMYLRGLDTKIGLLTITFPYAPSLTTRSTFFDHVHEVITKRESIAKADYILRGLKYGN